MSPDASGLRRPFAASSSARHREWTSLLLLTRCGRGNEERRRGERRRRRWRWSEKGGVIYHCLLSAGLPSSLQASAKWNRKDKAGARKKKLKNKRKGDDTNRPRGDTELHADACDTRRDEGERYRDQCPHVAVKGI